MLKTLLISFTIFCSPLIADIIPYSGSEYAYEIQQAGIYQITAWGAQGGSGFFSGGGGAILSAEFTLTVGSEIDFFVGGSGGSGFEFGGGGGGTFVVLDSNLLLAAGGGGGGSYNGNGLNASLTSSGITDGSGFNAGGQNGSSGTPDGSSGGGAGAGFLTSCVNVNVNSGCGFSDFTGGESFGSDGGSGGFGGGGGSGQGASTAFAGGGGGYSGGGAGAFGHGAGGGGTYVDASAISGATRFSNAFNFSNGQAEITEVSAAAPEPSYGILLGLALIGLLAWRTGVPDRLGAAGRLVSIEFGLWRVFQVFRLRR